MNSKLESVQALRAFAVMLVVLLHLLAVESKYSQFEVLLPTFFRIGISGVDLFFVISGFIMVTVTGNYSLISFVERRISAIRFIYLRLTRIYPLYWLFTMLVLAIFLVHPTFLNIPVFDLRYVLNSFFLLPQHALPLVMVGWSLVHEMYFYLVFFGLLLFPRKYLAFLLFIWLCVVIGGFQRIDYFDPEQNPFTRLAVSPLTVEFIAGCYLALMFEYLRKKPVYFPFAKTSIALGLVSLGTLWHFFSFDAQTIDVVGWTRVYLFTGPYLLMMYGALALEKNREAVTPAWAVRIGDYSYSIYLTHVLVLSLCGRVWKTFAWEGYLDNIIILSCTVAAVLMVGKICFYVLEKPILNYSRHFVP